MNSSIFKTAHKILLALALLAFAGPAAAQTTTFAQFVQNGSTNSFTFTNNGANGTFSTIPGGVPVFFFYQGITGLDASLTGPQFAHMYVTSTTTQPSSVASGTLSQPLNQTITIQIIRDTPAPVGTSTQNNLLTAVITPAGQTPAITGTDGGNSGTFSVTTPDHNITFSSHFLSFGATTERNLGLSFSSVAPAFAAGAGGFLQTIAAAGTGTFASNPGPVVLIPRAADVSVSGRVLAPGGKGLLNADVVFTDVNGTQRVTRSNSFGYFHLGGIPAGSAGMIEVRSKRYAYAPQFLSLSDSISDLRFESLNK